MPDPIRATEFGRQLAAEMAAIAETLPYRMELGIDPERVVWADIAGHERIGVAWVSSGEYGPHWMIAIANVDRRKVTRQRVREIVATLTGRAGPFELAPSFETAPHMTMVRVPDDR
jgi:hypothetical protein